MFITYSSPSNGPAPQLVLVSRKIPLLCRRLAVPKTPSPSYNSITSPPAWLNNKWNLAQPMDTWHGVTLTAQGCVLGIELDNNQLDGAIPSLDLPELQLLNLSQNNLSGALPNLNLPELKQLYLNNNILSGNIPNFGLPKLEEIFLYANQTSLAPSPISICHQLRTLLLSAMRSTAPSPISICRN